MRVDPVMGLARLWWIPAGMPPGQGHIRGYGHELLARSWPRAECSAPSCSGSSGGPTARRAGRADGGAAAWPRSARAQMPPGCPAAWRDTPGL